MLLRTIFTLLVLPPALNFIVLLIGGLIIRRHRLLGSVLLLCSLGSLYGLSLPVTKTLLYESLEIHPALKLSQIEKMSGQTGVAIVVLGGGRMGFAPEYLENDTPKPSVLSRVRYGARLQQQTGLPIALTGGSVFDYPLSEAEMMQQVLQEFGGKADWLESESKTTWQNAAFLKEMLQAADYQHVVLVTEAFHMRRSVYCFEQMGFTVTPAPTLFRHHTMPSLNYLPDATSLALNKAALKEWLGMLWYRYFQGV